MKKNNKDSDIVKWSQIKSWINHFINNIPVEQTIRNHTNIYDFCARQKFKSDTLVTIEQKIDSSSNLDTSPLIEAIQYIRSKDFPPPAVIDQANYYQFVIWSDMIQNSDQANHFAELGNYKTVIKNNPIDLKGIGLSVFQLRSKRYSKFQTNEHVAWWRKFIAYANGELNGWDPI